MFEALRYPARGRTGEKAVLAAWLCVFLHAIALPVLALVPLVGYLASVLVAGGERTPPPVFERSLLARSLGAAVLTVAYAAGPVAIVLVTVRLLLETAREPTGADVFVVFAGSTAVLATLAVAAYLLPIALANYATAGSLRAGFSTLSPVATHAGYFVGWCSGLVLALVGVTLSSGLLGASSALTVVGAFVGGYTALVATRRVARGYALASERR
ncbi:DUF4013 domain-containing protein [Natronobiforma cellulositropha]|uniref:DUF4013 domain-containing protein n=1 Tax=Natronobiforma cellulositropha TaxID=1679076 RepID=UPI0021D5C71F|nr:DUF4013 domain-containing protein [Natronobiforma cellulositropha]